MWSPLTNTLMGIILLALPAAAQRARDGTVVAPGIGERLDAAVKQAAPDHWGAILVARGDRVLLAKGYGLADGEKRANTPRTLFDVGRVAEQFTAAAVLRLESDRRLKIDEPISRFFRNAPADKAGITIRQLLDHTSGLPEKVKWPRGGGAGTNPRVMVDSVMAAVLRSDPGEQFVHSRLNYLLLAFIVQEASRKQFEVYLKRQLFTAVRMKDTGFVQDPKLDKRRDSIRKFGKGKQRTALDYEWNWSTKGSLGVVTTVHDLHLWLRALQDNTVLKEAARDELLPSGVGSKGFGWSRDARVGIDALRCVGGTAGYTTWLQLYQKQDASLVMIGPDRANLAPLGLVLEKVLLEAVAEESPAAATEHEQVAPTEAPSKPTVPDFELGGYVGSYRLPGSSGRFDISLAGGALWIEGRGVEAGPRVRYGLSHWPDDPELLRGLGGRAEAGLEALRSRGDPGSAFGDAADPAALSAARVAWQRLINEVGRCRGLELLGTAIDDGKTAETWLRGQFGGSDVLLRVTWSGAREFTGLSRESGPHPFRVALEPRWQDFFTGVTPVGKLPFVVTFEGEDRQRVLVWEDAMPGDAGLIECPIEGR